MSLRKAQTRIPGGSGKKPEVIQLFQVVESCNVKQLKKYIERFAISECSALLECQNENGCTPLGVAAGEGNLEIVKELLNAGASVNKSDFYGQTPLHYACEYGHLNVADLLIQKRADVNKYDNLSAMHITCCKGYTEIAKLLMKSGCNINAQDKNGVSVLHCAVANGHTEIVLALLEAGVQVNIAGSNTSRTPIYLAVGRADVQIVKALVKCRAKLNYTDDFGMTALCLACLQNSTDVAGVLIEAGSRVNLADNKDNLPIHYAARNGNEQLTEMLIKHGSEMNTLNGNFSSPLHLAVAMGHVHVVKLLVEKGCDVNICDKYGNVTALHVAVNSYTDVDLFNQVLQILIEGGCGMDSQAFASLESPLYRAIDQSKPQLALCLLQHGASPNVECPFDITLLQKACQRKQMSVVNTLLYSGLLDWTAEQWLEMDIHHTGINPKLLKGYVTNIPMTLINNVELYFEINEVRHNPMSLLRLCRLLIRKCFENKLHIKVVTLDMPKRIQDFLMFKIL